MKKTKILMTFALLSAMPQGAWAEGELNGVFTVNSSGKQVCFSQGNLQAVFASAGSSRTWQFATNQWDYIGSAAANTSINGSGSVSAAGTVDLFGWVGTSSSYDNYGIWNNTTANSYGNTKNESLKHDWGHNAITNGGNTADVWRTLTREEWGYMLSTRSGATVNGTNNVRFAKATIRTDETAVKGLLLLPDGVTFDAGEASWGVLDDGNENYTTTCTAAQWTALEAKGCVFLPAAGNRTGTTVSDAGTGGAYWAATGSDTSNGYYAYRLYFASTSWSNPQYYSQQEKSYGHSVRLVKDVPTYSASFATGSGGDGWSISPTSTTAGQTVTVSYSGGHKVKSVKVKKPLRSASAVDVGKVIGADGYIYTNVSEAESEGTTAAALIFYYGAAGTADNSAGSTYKGLAIALGNTSGQWASQTGNTCVAQGTAFSSHVATKNGISSTNTLAAETAHTHTAAQNTKNYAVYTPECSSGWFMPATGQWLMFLEYCGVTLSNWSNYGSGSGDYTKIYNKFNAVGAASAMTSGYFWTSTEYNANQSVYIRIESPRGVNALYAESKTQSASVRPFLAF